MIRDQFFFDREHGYATISNKIQFEAMWKKLTAFEKSFGVSVDDGLTREQYINLFSFAKVTRPTMFNSFKAALLLYIDYLVSQETLSGEHAQTVDSISIEEIGAYDVDAAISEANKKKDENKPKTPQKAVAYHKDLESLHKAIQFAVSKSKGADPSIFDMRSVALYLTWYGVDRESILNYKKSDVLDDGIIINGEKVEPPADVLRIFIRARDAIGYYQSTSNVAYHIYVPSEYLIRTEHSVHVNYNTLQASIARLNNLAPQLSLTFNPVRISGMLYRAHIAECEDPNFSLNIDYMAKVFDIPSTNTALIKSRIEDYKIYKQMFYPNEE